MRSRADTLLRLRDPLRDLARHSRYTVPADDSVSMAATISLGFVSAAMDSHGGGVPRKTPALMRVPSRLVSCV
jgi:hypothetical protein